MNLPKRTLNDWVLIRPSSGNTQVRLPSGQTFMLDISYEKEIHAVTSGEVILPCGNLQPGDKVYFHYLQVINSLERSDPKYITVNNELLVLIEYSQSFAYQRDNKLYPLHDYNLLEPVMKQKGHFDTVNKNDARYGRAKYMSNGIKEGEVCILSKMCDLPLEYSIHETVEPLYRVKNNLILGVV